MNRWISLWLLVMLTTSCVLVTSRPIREEKQDKTKEHISNDLQQLFRSRRLTISREDDRGTRLLAHIMDQINKGHVSQEMIGHWQAELMHGIQSGILTQEQVTSFLQSVSTMHITNGEHPNPFWLG